jgi:hypothetical protein
MRFLILSRRQAHRPKRVFNVREARITVNHLAMNQTPLVHSTSSITHAHHSGVSAPHGGVLSPQLANVYLNVLDTSVSGVQQSHTDRKGMGTQVCFTDTAPPNYQ